MAYFQSRKSKFWGVYKPTNLIPSSFNSLLGTLSNILRTQTSRPTRCWAWPNKGRLSGTVELENHYCISEEYAYIKTTCLYIYTYVLSTYSTYISVNHNRTAQCFFCFDVCCLIWFVYTKYTYTTKKIVKPLTTSSSNNSLTYVSQSSEDPTNCRLLYPYARAN